MQKERAVDVDPGEKVLLVVPPLRGSFLPNLLRHVVEIPSEPIPEKP
jgi:hypothetical protein